MDKVRIRIDSGKGGYIVINDTPKKVCNCIKSIISELFIKSSYYGREQIN